MAQIWRCGGVKGGGRAKACSSHEFSILEKVSVRYFKSSIMLGRVRVMRSEGGRKGGEGGRGESRRRGGRKEKKLVLGSFLHSVEF